MFKNRCEICLLSHDEHGADRQGRVYSAPFGWHEHTSVAGRSWPYTPPPPGYRDRNVNLATPATPEPDPKNSFTPWKRETFPGSFSDSLERSPVTNHKPEPHPGEDLLPRPRRWWGRWREGRFS